MEKYGPKKADHPTIGKFCSLCNNPLKAGDYTTLVPIEAGFASPEDADKAMSGRPYNIEAEEVHFNCAVAINDKTHVLGVDRGNFFKPPPERIKQ